MGELRIEDGRLSGATQRQLAALYQVPQSTLSGWVAAGVDVSSPLAVAGYVARSDRKPKSWAELGVDETEDAAKQEKLKQEIRKLKLDADKAQRLLEILDGDYLPKATVEEQQAAIAYVTNAWMRAAAAELPPILSGMEAAAMEDAIKTWQDPWVDRVKDADSEVWREAERAIQRELRGDLKRVAVANSRRGDG